MTEDDGSNIVPFSQKYKYRGKIGERIPIKPLNFVGQDKVLGTIEFTTSTCEMAKEICEAFGVEVSVEVAIALALRMARAVALELKEDPNTQVIFSRSDGTDYTLVLESLFPTKNKGPTR